MFDARQFQVIAKELLAGDRIPPGEERCSRTVAGRAYYAAFLATRDAARQALSAPRLNVKHERWYTFLKKRPGVMRTVGQRLNTLHAYRVRSDYFDDVTISHDDAEACAAALADVFDNLDAFVVVMEAFKGVDTSYWRAEDQDAPPTP